MSNRAERRRGEKLAAKHSAYHDRIITRPNAVKFHHKLQNDLYLKVKPSEAVSDEKLVSCAIMHMDTNIISKGYHSHWELRSNLGYEDPSKFKITDHPGFWTSKDRFVKRKEAMYIAFEAGQIRQIQQREFLSSDVDVW